MNKPKLALCCIVKDDTESEIFERMLNSFMPYFDGLYVAVTGTSKSHKKIHELVKKFNGKSISTDPKSHPQIYAEIGGKKVFANFAEARNVSFSLVDDKYDFLSWADTDDVLLNGEDLLNVATMAKEQSIELVYFTYMYSVDMDGSGIKNINIAHQRERLIKPGVTKWVSRLHEVCVGANDYQPKMSDYAYDPAQNQLCAWVHLTNDERTLAALDRNLAILELQAKEENNEDPRTIFYLAKIYFERRQNDDLSKAKELLGKYLELSGWEAERSHAYEYLGLINETFNDLQEAYKCYQQAHLSDPTNHIPYLRMAGIAYRLGLKPHADAYLDIALRMEPPKSRGTITNLKEIKLLAAAVAYNKARIENNLQDMEQWASIRHELMDEKDGLYEDVMYTKNLNTAAIGVFNLAKWLNDNGYSESIEPVLKQLPDELISQPYTKVLANKVLEPKKWGDNSIVYFASFGFDHFEQWGPESLKTGIGGSETAVIRLSEQWASMGYDVTVYCDTSEQGVHNGVTYVNHNLFNWNDEFNTLILWRSPHLLDNDIKAKKLIMDLHDIANPLDWSSERIDKVNRIMVKSKYHRNNLPNIDDEKFVVVSNGLEMDSYIGEKSNNVSIFYGSSYDRGLIHLLKMWPDIKKAVPDATLDICYGWDLFIKGYANNPERMMWKEKMDEMMKQDGITHHGRVGRDKLQHIRGKCRIWAYPTDFNEINCMTALECQRDGTVPVVVNKAALAETVGDECGVKINGDIYLKETREEYLKELVSLATDKKRIDVLSNNGRKFVKKFTWEKIAKVWSDEF